jgi:hypothetical protein
MYRLNPLAEAMQKGEFDPQNVRTWPIALLKLDEDGATRRLEKMLLARHITMVTQLLGPASPLADPKNRRRLGKKLFRALERKLEPYGIIAELAWRLLPPPDSRRALQDEIEKRIQELNRRAEVQL